VKNKSEEIQAEVSEQFKDSAMSESSKSIMRVRTERNRLRQELDDIQDLVDELTPATPTGTIDSHVKWFATILGVAGVFIMSAGFGIAGQVCYAMAAIAWVYVGHCWNDKAIMIGSAISGTAVCMNLSKVFI
jgi:hypothetical protein